MSEVLLELDKASIHSDCLGSEEAGDGKQIVVYYRTADNNGTGP